ncbi:MAG: hypothetical protein KJN97_01590 [Deltaproteobacteria bacterium]|nr:hypothetical protein [Deltaproteobacteria bacterium]
MDSKKVLLIGVVLVFAAALLVRYLGKAPEEGSVEEPSVAEHSDDGTVRAASDDGTPPAVHDAGAAPVEAIADPAPSGYEDHPSIRQYRAITRYPSSTRRLTTQSTDLLHPNKRHERRQAVPDPEANADRAWEVLYTADRYFVRGEEPITVSLALWHEGEPVIPTNVVMVAAPAGASGSADRVNLAVERVDSELRALLVPNEHWPKYIGELEVTATFAAPGLQTQTGRLTFYFTANDRIPARFTGQFSDDTTNGDLAVTVGVNVATEGVYRIEANLFDRNDQPIAWAQAETNLSPGTSDVSLVFYGLAFHDAGAVAPFTMRQLRGYRLRRGDSPHREDMPAYDADYETAARYSLADFRSVEHESPHKQRMLQRYRDAIERGVVLTEPEFVGDGRQP